MKIHYFQRYQKRENVITANTMLLLSRLYQYSPDKFFQFLKTGLFEEEIEPEISFHLQEKHEESVPDATITQESFKIIVETKLTSGKFDLEQLKRHLLSFNDEKYKVLLTLDKELMDGKSKEEIEKETTQKNIYHVNLTFTSLADTIQDVLTEHDIEMQDILDDYISSCEYAGVMGDTESWKWMWMALASNTLDFNKDNNLYYNKEERSRRKYDYLGLYDKKSIRAIGKVCARFIACNEQDIQSEDGSELTEERKDKILLAMKENTILKGRKHRYFFVDKFYDTNYRKITKGAPMGGRKFDLVEILNTSDIPSVDQIAKLLENKTWA